ncbi:MAG: GNAT family N-acetyltransferase [Sneathiella sp.]|uniref:GNAT family N-acetyltransferase n=1 Tax=Sneathiella sp. TaxID=1964365 RepID=UPI000C55CFE8|nr:GNAT family N-acetyltransferase [Sneathiella sp.]MAZ02423.1 GNAT family N-acetyltransferase [Sneathiella sp.]
MAGFFGTEQQMALQAAAEKARDWMLNTPGACDPGRFLGTDNPDLLGWDTLFDILKRDGVFGFRLIPSEETETIAQRLQEKNCKIDFWDVFVATREEAVPASTGILAAGLPAGYRYCPEFKDAESADMVALQSFMAEQGIAPFSGTRLAGLEGPVVTVAIVDESNTIAAAAHSYFPYNQYSPYKKWVWGGLVAVSPRHRGMGLGKFVNAKMVSECFARLDADCIHELVAASNMPSRKMVEASGLRLEPALKCGIAMVGGNGRFTS